MVVHEKLNDNVIVDFIKNNRISRPRTYMSWQFCVVINRLWMKLLLPRLQLQWR